jgi:hypothetical protein
VAHRRRADRRLRTCPGRQLRSRLPRAEREADHFGTLGERSLTQAGGRARHARARPSSVRSTRRYSAGNHHARRSRADFRTYKSPPPAAAPAVARDGRSARPGRCYRAANDLVSESLRANDLPGK